MNPRVSLFALVVTVFGCLGGRSDVGDGVGPGASSCPRGSILFTMKAGSAGDYCIGAPASCSNQWLTILDAKGAEFAVDRPCVPDCASCEAVACPALCAAPSRIPTDGVERTWDGTYYAPQTCGSNTSCVDTLCASPGRYIARMCAYADPSHQPFCSPEATPTCADVAFDWPPADGTETVLGVIGGSSACCPASWLMYACTSQDGGAGFNCHNPAMGCASSSTCGEGCDFAVTGRCTTQP